MSRGPVMSSETSALAWARNAYVGTTLHSWISPTWAAGTRVAVTWTVWRGPTRLGFTAMVVDASATWHSPSTSRSTRTAAIPRTMRRLSRSERFAGLAESWPLGDG